MAAEGRFLAVPISYANWAACMSVNAELYQGGHYGKGFDGSERFLTVQQVMHGTGMLGTFPFIHMGLPQVVLPRFDAAAVLEAAERHRATATFMVPGMVTRLADVGAGGGASAGARRRRAAGYGGSSTAALRSPRTTSSGPSISSAPYSSRSTAGSKAAGRLAILSTADHRELAAGKSPRAWQLRAAHSPNRPADPAHPRPKCPLGRAVRAKRHGRRRLGRPRRLVRPRGPGQD